MSAHEATGRSSLNPFDVRGTPLPPNVLLAAKLVTMVFLITGGWRLTDPFLPFVSFLGDLTSPSVFQHTLQAIWLAAAASLLANRFVRASCIVLGGVILLALLSSQAYRTNNLTFTALLLLLIGLSDRTTAATLIRGQFVVLYFWAGMNKLLDGNWRSGAFFETWNSLAGYGSAYHALASRLPAMALSTILSWGVIVTELVIAVMFAVRRLVPVGILLVIVYHSSLFLVTGSTFTMFWYSLTAASVALLYWPTAPPLVAYSDTGRLARLCGLLRKLDLGRAFVWRRQASSGLRVEIDGQLFTGRDALARLLLYHPTLYVIFFALVAAPQPQRRWAALVAIGAVAYATFSLLRRRFSPAMAVET